MAMSMKRRLEIDKERLRQRLETVQEEADTAKYRQGLAEEQLERVRAESSSAKSSTEADGSGSDVIKKLQRQLDELRAREGVVTDEKEAFMAKSEREELLDLQARMGKLYYVGVVCFGFPFLLPANICVCYH